MTFFFWLFLYTQWIECYAELLLPYFSIRDRYQDLRFIFLLVETTQFTHFLVVSGIRSVRVL
jgi:hypothetical protein